MKELSEKQYNRHLDRIEFLLNKVDNSTPTNDKYYQELNEISNVVSEYEEQYFTIEKPSLVDVIKLRMEEMEINQKQLAELLSVTASRVSEYLKGKRDITLEVAKKLKTKLDIDSDIILQ